MNGTFDVGVEPQVQIQSIAPEPSSLVVCLVSAALFGAVAMKQRLLHLFDRDRHCRFG
jgi:hypothetical protein